MTISKINPKIYVVGLILIVALGGAKILKDQQVSKDNLDRQVKTLQGQIQKQTEENAQLKKQIEDKAKEVESLKQAKASANKPIVYTKPSTVNVEQYRPLVAKYFPSNEVDNALVIMTHESGGNPNAVSPTNDHGLMQIHAPLWTNFFGVTTDQLKDPETNIKLASTIWQRGGWRAWSTYRYLSS